MQQLEATKYKYRKMHGFLKHFMEKSSKQNAKYNNAK